LESIFYNNFITMAGVMFAAIVGGFFSFVSLISSKEQKVSEFRQQWIDGLRCDLSILFSSARALCRTMQEARSPNTGDEDIQDFKFGKEKIGQMRSAGADALYRVKLRLNKNEPEHQKLQRLLEAAINIQNQINIEKGRDYTAALEAIEHASDYSQGVLKAEWERVKKGEPSYRTSKYFSVAVLFIGLIIFGFNTYIIISSKPSESVAEQGISGPNSDINKQPSDKRPNNGN